MYLLQTVYTMIKFRIIRYLICVYTLYQRPFYGTLGINGLTTFANSVHYENTPIQIH